MAAPTKSFELKNFFEIVFNQVLVDILINHNFYDI